MRRRIEQLRGEARTVAAGATPRDRLRILRILANAHLRLGRGRRVFGRRPAPPDPPRQVRLRRGERLLARRADAVVLYEHFGLDVYGVPLPLDDVRCIVDLGANVGFSTLALRRHHPRARFVCVEPAAVTRAVLRENLARNGVDAEVLGVAVVGEAGSYSLAESHFPAAHRVVASVEGDIEGVTLSELLERARVNRVDLLKIDVEGAEREIFAAAGEWAGRVRGLIGELHGDFTPREAARLLGPHGFTPVALGDGVRGRSLCCFVRPDH